MKLDKRAIETISVNTVRNSITVSPFLDQFIADNDKEPSWDGNVYIYNDASKTKDKIEGRMPVQVKGKVCGDFSKKEISHSMETADLQNYLSDGGAILFVVYMTEDGATTKIYFAELTPIKLKVLISEAGPQKTKTVKLKEFPLDGNEKATIFVNCLQNCRKQASFANTELPTLEELEKLGIIESLTIPFAGAGIRDPITALLGSEAYLYANLKGSAIPQPIEVIPRDLTAKTKRTALVKAGDRPFYSEYCIIRNAKSTTLQFGESFFLCFSIKDTKPVSCKVNYKNSPFIRILAVDLEFFLHIISSGYIEINDKKFPIELAEAEFSNFSIDEERKRLDFAKRTVKVLDVLNCKEDLNLLELSDVDVRNLMRLSTAMLDKKPISGLREDIPLLANMDIGKLKLTLIFTPDKDVKGTYTITDFSNCSLSLGYTGASGKELRTSQYAIYHAKDLVSVSNIRPELFLPSFQEIENEESYIRANFFLLELLTAYDLSDGTRNDLLKTAEDFAQWLKDTPNDQLDIPFTLLNYYQVIKRKRKLNMEEQEELWKIAENTALPDEYKVGAYLLLDQQIPASRYFNKLPPVRQKEFITFPIYHFWKE